MFCESKTGEVILVSAGCKGKEWLTLAACNALKHADVVVYDALLDPDILDLADQAEKIYAGKRGHSKSVPQSEINEMLLELAGKYTQVVRLKGGDSLIFGRAAEEKAFLEAHGVSVSIIPGISSLAALPMQADIFLTQRNISSSFAAISGVQVNSLLQEDWKTLADFKGTLVVFMGLSKSGQISRLLMENGKDAQTPSALLHEKEGKITCTKTTLERLPYQAENFPSPALIVIGKAASGQCRHVRLGTTASRQWNEKLWNALDPRIELIPVLETDRQDLHPDLQALFQWNPQLLVFTSPYGVSSFFKEMKDQKIDIRTLGSVEFACIGEGTKNELKKHGIYQMFMPASFHSHALAELICRSHAEKRTVLLQTEQALDELYKQVSKVSETIQIPLYSIEIRKPAYPVSLQDLDGVLFASASAVEAWSTLYPGVADIQPYCISKRLCQKADEIFDHPAGLLPSCIAAECAQFFNEITREPAAARSQNLNGVME